MRYGQVVIGPAGSGKSTYCAAMQKHAETMNRRIKMVNLDPAAEHFEYDCWIDVRELISIDDVMEADDLRLGPNGGLLYCMQFIVENLEWLQGQLEEDEDDYVIFDCPGQIELYTHMPYMRQLVDTLQAWEFRLCAVFVLDTQFMLDMPKFFSGALVGLSSMVSLELPAVNVLSKMDLLNDSNKQLIELQEFLQPNAECLLDQPSGSGGGNSRYEALTRGIAQILDDYSLVKFTPLDITDEDSLNDVLMAIDQSIQFGEDADVKDRYPADWDPDEDDDAGGNGLTGH